MQTLTAGSFLNLENASTIEALKFTARLLAEHTANVVSENLNAHQLENLANSLWDKAGYVTRETERRRLQQIFVENFSERLREIKPFSTSAEKSVFETPPADSVKQFAPAIEGEKDEFLGIVKTDEPFAKEMVAETETPFENLGEEIEQPVAQTSVEIALDAPNLENHSNVVEPPNLENQVADLVVQTELSEVENSKTAKTEEVTVTPDSKLQTEAIAGKSSTNTPHNKEPFEFEKCTISLNLTLLPVENGQTTRKVIVGAVSHNLPPEIDFLEIVESGDLANIADLVREKLGRFRQTLPVKYIEQLRTAKLKSAKSGGATKANIVAPSQLQGNPTTAEKPLVETRTEENKTTALLAFVPTVNQPVAANEVQGSLF